MTERTLSIIKPDAVENNHIGKIIDRFESNGLAPIALKKIRLSRQRAEEFYAEHSERPFFGELVDFMISGPIVVQILEGENAIKKNREIMGATRAAEAAPGTIRYDLSRDETDLSRNAVHGSDSAESAAREMAFFFTEDEIVG